MFDRHRKKSHQENIALNWGKDLGLRASVLLVREKTHFTINVRGKKKSLYVTFEENDTPRVS